MKTRNASSIVIFLCVTFIALAPTALWASGYRHWTPSIFSKLSINHTDYGVSQYQAGPHSGDLPSARECPEVEINGQTYEPDHAIVRLMNPTPVTQIAAVIVYARGNPRGLGTPEKYITSDVQRLTPHAALSSAPCIIPLVDSDDNVSFDRPLYIEVISAPEEPVYVWHKRTRLANGLGLIGTAGGNVEFIENLRLIHPSLFSLPDDGQSERAIRDICRGLQSVETSLEVFEQFGIICPEPDGEP